MQKLGENLPEPFHKLAQTLMAEFYGHKFFW